MEHKILSFLSPIEGEEKSLAHTGENKLSFIVDETICDEGRELFKFMADEQNRMYVQWTIIG